MLDLAERFVHSLIELLVSFNSSVENVNVNNLSSPLTIDIGSILIIGQMNFLQDCIQAINKRQLQTIENAMKKQQLITNKLYRTFDLKFDSDLRRTSEHILGPLMISEYSLFFSCLSSVHCNLSSLTSSCHDFSIHSLPSLYNQSYENLTFSNDYFLPSPILQNRIEKIFPTIQRKKFNTNQNNTIINETDKINQNHKTIWPKTQHQIIKVNNTL